MIYGYLRVSTDNQDVENQKQGIVRWLKYKGFVCNEWIIEHGVSGKKDYKTRLLGKLIEKLNSNDWLVVSELSRLSRSIINTFELVKELKLKKVNVYCVKENLQISDDAIGLMVLSSFAFAAQVERERISQRTKEALERKKKDGVHLGRPFGYAHRIMSLENTKDYIFNLVSDGVSGRQIAQKLNVSYRTLRTFLDKYGVITKQMEKYSNYKKKTTSIQKRQKNKCFYLGNG